MIQGPGTVMILRDDELGGFGRKRSFPQLSLKSAHTGEGAAKKTRKHDDS